MVTIVLAEYTSQLPLQSDIVTDTLAWVPADTCHDGAMATVLAQGNCGDDTYH
jgi:hypothetical protein